VDAAYVQSEKKQSVELIKKIVELTANYQREELNGKVVKVFKSYK
jgi:hypothetical protein